jgi:hypothetical protein
MKDLLSEMPQEQTSFVKQRHMNHTEGNEVQNPDAGDSQVIKSNDTSQNFLLKPGSEYEPYSS